MNIRSFFAFALTALTLAMANPIPDPSPIPISDSKEITLHRRQGMSSNDLKQGDCKPVAFIFARGSTEMGNMVSFLSLYFPIFSLSLLHSTNLTTFKHSLEVRMLMNE